MCCPCSSSGVWAIPGLLLFQISVMDQFLCHFFAELQLAVVVISIKIVVSKGAVDLRHSKQERMDPMWPSLCSPCLLQTDGTLSSVVVIIHSMPVFEVIVHNLQIPNHLLLSAFFWTKNLTLLFSNMLSRSIG